MKIYYIIVIIITLYFLIIGFGLKKGFLYFSFLGFIILLVEISNKFLNQGMKYFLITILLFVFYKVIKLMNLQNEKGLGIRNIKINLLLLKLAPVFIISIIVVSFFEQLKIESENKIIHFAKDLYIEIINKKDINKNLEETSTFKKSSEYTKKIIMKNKSNDDFHYGYNLFHGNHNIDENKLSKNDIYFQIRIGDKKIVGYVNGKVKKINL